jgi:hypothetical protein
MSPPERPPRLTTPGYARARTGPNTQPPVTRLDAPPRLRCLRRDRPTHRLSSLSSSAWRMDTVGRRGSHRAGRLRGRLTRTARGGAVPGPRRAAPLLRPARPRPAQPRTSRLGRRGAVLQTHRPGSPRRPEPHMQAIRARAHPTRRCRRWRSDSSSAATSPSKLLVTARGARISCSLGAATRCLRQLLERRQGCSRPDRRVPQHAPVLTSVRADQRAGETGRRAPIRHRRASRWWSGHRRSLIRRPAR